MKILKHFRKTTDSSSSVRMKTRSGAKESPISIRWNLLHRVESGKSRIDFVPLKGHIMANAKYLRKRIALVAAAALGVGMLAAAPAFASTLGYVTQGSSTAVTTVTPNSAASVTADIYGTISGTSTASDAMTFTATVKDSAGTATATPTVATAGFDSTVLVVGSATSALFGEGVATNVFTITNFTTALPAFTNKRLGTVTFTPNTGVGGAYVLTLTSSNATPTTSTLTINLSGATTPFNVVSPTGATGVGTSSIAVSQTAGAGNLVKLTPVIATAATVLPNKDFASVTGSTFSSASGASYTLDSGAVTATFAAAGLPVGTASDLYVNTPTAGTVTVKYYSRTYSGGIATDTLNQTITITVTNATGTTYSYTTVGTASLSGTSVVQTVSGATLATAVAGTQAESWTVSQKDASGVTLSTAASSALTVSIAGVGAIKINSGTSGGYATLSAGSAQVGSAGVSDTVAVISDGRAGTSVVTIAVNGVTVATKTLTFYGAVASLTAVANKSVIKNNSATLTAATVTAKDAAGTLVPFVVVGKFSAVSSSLPVLLSSDTFAEDLSINGDFGGQGNYTATVTSGVLSASGQTATITYTYTSGTLVVNAAPVTFTIGGAATTVTFALDKTSYAPGSVAVLTVTAKDSAGNAAANGTVVLANALVSNVAASGLPNTADLKSKNGTATLSIYAPATSGTWIVTDASNTVTGAAISARATVTGVSTVDTTTAAAVAANAAAITALQASVASLSTTIASLVASITAQISALSALVKKILAKGGTRGSGSPTLPATGKK